VTGLDLDSGAPCRAGGADMSYVRKHVEEMAKQYVQRLSVAEEELKAVGSVWQQAGEELTALRKQQGGSPRAGSPRAGARRSPSFTDLVSLEHHGAGPNGSSQHSTADGAAAGGEAAGDVLTLEGNGGSLQAENGGGACQCLLELAQLAPCDCPRAGLWAEPCGC